jgi:hypothetical protein
VARLMRQAGIRGASRAKKHYTTHADKTALRAPDLVKRDFTAACQRSSNSLVGGCAVQVFPWSVVQVIP